MDAAEARSILAELKELEAKDEKLHRDLAEIEPEVIYQFGDRDQAGNPLPNRDTRTPQQVWEEEVEAALRGEEEGRGEEERRTVGGEEAEGEEVGRGEKEEEARLCEGGDGAPQHARDDRLQRPHHQRQGVSLDGATGVPDR